MHTADEEVALLHVSLVTAIVLGGRGARRWFCVSSPLRFSYLYSFVFKRLNLSYMDYA